MEADRKDTTYKNRTSESIGIPFEANEGRKEVEMEGKDTQFKNRAP